MHEANGINGEVGKCFGPAWRQPVQTRVTDHVLPGAQTEETRTPVWRSQNGSEPRYRLTNAEIWSRGESQRTVVSGDGDQTMSVLSPSGAFNEPHLQCSQVFTHCLDGTCDTVTACGRGDRQAWAPSSTLPRRCVVHLGRPNLARGRPQDRSRAIPFGRAQRLPGLGRPCSGSSHADYAGCRWYIHRGGAGQPFRTL